MNLETYNAIWAEPQTIVKENLADFTAY